MSKAPYRVEMDGASFAWWVKSSPMAGIVGQGRPTDDMLRKYINNYRQNSGRQPKWARVVRQKDGEVVAKWEETSPSSYPYASS